MIIYIFLSELAKHSPDLFVNVTTDRRFFSFEISEFECE